MSARNPLPRFAWHAPFPRPTGPRPEAFPVEAEGRSAGPLFQGMRYDPAQAGLFAFAYRAFDPTVNPWTNHEPLAYVDGLNLYTFRAANPINAVNPLGA
jgi:RHS repeat-associated protein